ncbi:MAG: OmpH family outer membrane protein [Candidatus Synoicihabitans palmerolidicus]|nr:OmpH family outer membrane protein [Candidatus Synoicihabitans palmerolidicus]
MKKSLKPLLALVALAFATTVSFAQSPKIAIVDMARLFDSHYKTAEKNAVFQGEQERAKAEIARLNGEGLFLQEEVQNIGEQLNNPVHSEAAQTQVRGEYGAKVQELQRKQEEMNALVQNRSKSLQKRVLNFRSLLMDEIGKVAVDVAKRQGAMLLLDKSGPSLLGMSVVMYYESSLEITDTVLAEINKDRPADVLPALAAAGEEAPVVSFPGGN